ncbi:YhgE/Pip domain-containing protein [Neobacillus drentensis]|uniref:YhgE/Pip domain-containing protein n=1 Tax=Neobacillus drentensis TaxID=220684 RepID=UPI002FFEC130
MKNIWRIYSTDIKKITTNWVVSIIVLGLIILPSLYAWLNIKASWDPYKNTERISIAIVNQDSGGMIQGQKINAGEDLVKTLKKNHSFGWHFVDYDKAMEKVKYGDYFAAIVIPKDFSQKLSTVVSKEPTKAHVKYYVNEKINAIAPKMTEKGASVLVEQISSKFTSSVNGVIFDLFNKLGIEMEKNLPDLERFQNYVFTLEEKLPDIKNTLDGTERDVVEAKSIIVTSQGIIPNAKDAITNGLKTIDDTTAFVNEAGNKFNDISPKVKSQLSTIQQEAHKLNSFVNGIQKPILDPTQINDFTTNLNAKINQTITLIDSIQKALQTAKEQVNTNGLNQQQFEQTMKNLQSLLTTNNGDQNTEELKKELDNLNQLLSKQLTPQGQIEAIDKAIKQLDVVKQTLQEIQKDATNFNHLVENMPTLQETKDFSNEVARQVDGFVNDYNNQVEPFVLKQMSAASTTLTQARGVLVSIQTTIPKVESLLIDVNKRLDDGKKILDYSLAQYPYVHEKVGQLADKIRKLEKEANIHDIINTLKNDPQAEKGFFAEPVVLDANKIFPIANYGTGMTPFYTVLAIWVGGLLLISLLSTDAHFDGNYTGRQLYFGRLLTFLTIGMLQSLVVTIGDILLLGVDVHSPFYFVLFGCISSFVFILIVYSLVAVFGDVGKALSIVLLVLQISSSGGTYPVVLLPEFFQKVNPFLPFTYAVDMMREALGGIVWKRVAIDLSYLTMFGAIAFVFGSYLKGPTSKLIRKFKEKSMESGLFH